MTGTDVDGNRVNMTAFVDSDGKGLKLVQGSYELGARRLPARPRRDRVGHAVHDVRA
ncbi:hypothetical protein [Paratractidigestivibacter sp.]|uniref:hypothetical protein n=1 Tax=Paratractidigestivibacter sp. TaxID=2847316 RepID=UPI004025DF49